MMTQKLSQCWRLDFIDLYFFAFLSALILYAIISSLSVVFNVVCSDLIIIHLENFEIWLIIG